MHHSVKDSDIVGKIIARVLQTEWEHLEEFSHCDFYIEFSDGTLIGLGFDTLSRIDINDWKRWNLKDVEIDSDFPSFWTPDGFTGIGGKIERVLTTGYGSVFLLISGRHYLTAEITEGQAVLCMHDHNAFLHYAQLFEFFDYWTDEPCIFENMRGIDLFITSSVDDLDLWHSSELFLTIGRLENGAVSDRLAVPNKPNRNGWIARFVVPEPGIYRITIQRQQNDFVTDVRIDEPVIVGGRLEIHVI